MEHQSHQPDGGEQQPERPAANSYGTDDPETQAHIENARIDAARERQQNRAKLERLIELGMSPDDAEAFIEFEDSVTGRIAESPQREEETPWPTHDADESAERVKQCEPRIYLADMTSAQRGISHGLWIDADQEPTELDDDVAAMLASSPTPEATEWVVQATEDFAGLDLHGYTDTTLISLLAKGVAEHGPAYSAWVTINGTDDRAMLERFEDFYVGNYESQEAWMREVADELGWQRERRRIADPLLSPYVTLDFAAMAQDVSATWDVVTGVDGRTYVFMR